MTQLDLFAQPAPPPAAVAESQRRALEYRDETIPQPSPTLAQLLPRRPFPWERRLAAAGDVPLELVVAANWSGIVLEALCLPTHSAHLHYDGLIVEQLPHAFRVVRLVFLRPAQVRPIARQMPLGIVGTPGWGCVRLCAAEAAAPDIADLLDGIEAARTEVLTS